jgi:hypothetical protein
MHCRRWLLLAFAGFLLACVPLSAATPGTFRGVLVGVAEGESPWVYLMGRNGLLRRVNVSHSQVSYASSFPKRERKKSARESLRAGAEVRVTAEQDGAGEWQAIEVEILQQSSESSLKNPR